jgi:hypothetical protein
MEDLRVLKFFRDDEDAHWMALEGMVGGLAGIYQIRLDLETFNHVRRIMAEVPFKGAKNTKDFRYPVTGVGEAKGGREHFFRIEIRWEKRSKVYKVPCTGTAYEKVKGLLDRSDHDPSEAVQILPKS